MTIVEYVGAIVVFVAVIGFLVIMRKAMKAQNKKTYSWIDDILLFTGIPLVMGYFMFQGFNPDNLDKTAMDVVRAPLSLIVLLWFLASCVLLLIRNPGQKK